MCCCYNQRNSQVCSTVSGNQVYMVSGGRVNNHRRQRGRRLKRNRSDQKKLMLLDNNSEINSGDPNLNNKAKHTTTKKPNNFSDPKSNSFKEGIQNNPNQQFPKDEFPSKMSSYW
ncbi:hypothetical protein CDAR_573991 [Caerostris darwini]|uniref:Uncharacterized protein n=1 Tax=Caerostris darwini TaxID=1538125 RepID=A0AAV4TB81_9ARAC|nr:hypothetical protein CDAR_573991 [Caerostris darwini]